MSDLLKSAIDALQEIKAEYSLSAIHPPGHFVDLLICTNMESGFKG